jgi:predicted nucleic acid-binding protein
MEKQVIPICVDTNIALFLSGIDFCLKNNWTIEKFIDISNNRSYNPMIVKEKDFIIKLYYAIANGEVRPYISPIVISELIDVGKEDREWVQKYISKYFTVIIPKSEFQYDKLVDLYMEPRGKLSEKAIKGSSRNDAYIMAHASVIGYNLITLNTRDFIKNGRDERIRGRNEEFYQSLSDEQKVSVSEDFPYVQPYTPSDYIKVKPYDKKCNFKIKSHSMAY